MYLLFIHRKESKLQIQCVQIDVNSLLPLLLHLTATESFGDHTPWGK